MTVCELRDEPEALAEDWRHLVAHVAEEQSDLVILPEMGFAPWFAASPIFDAATWQAAVVAHDAWLARLGELAPAVVLASRPVDSSAGRRDEGFVWSPAEGCRPARQKDYLPDEEGYWEARWYERGDGDFSLVQAGPASLGLLRGARRHFAVGPSPHRGDRPGSRRGVQGDLPALRARVGASVPTPRPARPTIRRGGAGGHHSAILFGHGYHCLP